MDIWSRPGKLLGVEADGRDAPLLRGKTRLELASPRTRGWCGQVARLVPLTRIAPALHRKVT